METSPKERVEGRVYWSKGDALPEEGERWYVHTYCLPEVDDYHVLCEYAGTNESGDLCFMDLHNDGFKPYQKLSTEELEGMIFKARSA